MRAGKSDRALVAQVLAGDSEAARTLAEDCHRDLYNLFLWLTSEPELSANLTQDAFLRIWSKLGQFQGRSGLRRWIHQIACSVLADHHRQVAREEHRFLNLQDAYAGGEPFSDLETRLVLLQALDQLSHQERQVIVLCKMQEFTLREASRILGEPMGTLAWRMAGAIRKLRALLTEAPELRTPDSHIAMPKEVRFDVSPGTSSFDS